MEIMKSNGLYVAIKVMERVSKQMKEQDLNCEITLDTFNNCRETGFVYKIYNKGKQLYIWTYEHRNSDDIVMLVSKDEDACDKNNMFSEDAFNNGRTFFKHNEFKKVADKIMELIISFESETGGKDEN